MRSAVAVLGLLLLLTPSVQSQDLVVREWLVYGPIPSGRDETRVLTDQLGGESTVLPTRGDAGWIEAETDPFGRLTLNEVFAGRGTEWSAAYGHVYVFTPEDRTVLLVADSDDDLVIRVNGQRVWVNEVARGLGLGADSVTVRLAEGWNSVMLKPLNRGGGFGLLARIAPGHGLLVSTAKPPGLVDHNHPRTTLTVEPRVPGAVRGGEENEQQLSVMSFNIRYGTAEDGANSWTYRRELVADVIRRMNPDVLGIQEALRFQLDSLHTALPRYAEVGVGRDDGSEAGEYAAILYRAGRFDVAEQGTFWFSDEPEVPGSVGWGAALPRICTWARLVERSSGRAFYVYNVHLDHQSQESRERSVRLLADRIAARAVPDPVMVMGDFNAGEDNPAMTYLLDGARLERGVDLRDTYRLIYPDATDVGTFNAFRGETTGPKIDAVLVSPEWRVGWAAIVRGARDGRYPSDHFPVVAVISLGVEGGGGGGER